MSMKTERQPATGAPNRMDLLLFRDFTITQNAVININETVNPTGIITTFAVLFSEATDRPLRPTWLFGAGLNGWKPFSHKIDGKLDYMSNIIDLTSYLKKEGSVTMTADFNAGNQNIINVGTPKANESDKAANVGFVVKEINN